jgi:hypothetical protein
MQYDNLQKAIRLLEMRPETPKTSKALELLRDEVQGPSQEGPVLKATKGQVEEIRPAKEGSYVLQKVKCGDPTCHCSKKSGDYHGPYWYLFTKKRGKTRSKYIGKNLPVEARPLEMAG